LFPSDLLRSRRVQTSHGGFRYTANLWVDPTRIKVSSHQANQDRPNQAVTLHCPTHEKQ
jgi:hypothetical protein